MSAWRKVGWRSARHRTLQFIVRFNKAGRGIGKVLPFPVQPITKEEFNALVKEAETVWPELQQQEKQKTERKQNEKKSTKKSGNRG